MPELMEAFPQLDDTGAATIYRAFSLWQCTFEEPICGDFEDVALVSFAAGWLNRPASDWSC